MADILQITEDIPVDDSIYEYEFKEYNPITGTDLNRGSIAITIESQDIYTHPAESFLVIEGQLLKNNDNRYLVNDNVALINNGIMYLFSDVRYHLASHEIEVLQNPGHATTMLGMLKYPDDFTKSQGLNQVWAPDIGDGTPVAENLGFIMRRNYIINMPTGNDNKGKFNFKIPLKHFLGFCEDYKKILYGMQQRLTLTRTNDNNAIFKGNAAAGGVADDGKIKIDKISWFMPLMLTGYNLIKLLRKKKKYLLGIECYNVIICRYLLELVLLLGGLELNHLQIYHVLL